MTRLSTLCALVAVVAAGTSQFAHAADSRAMLYAKGPVTVNGQAVSDSVAVFPGSVIETKDGAVANLNQDGSTIVLQPDTVAKVFPQDIYLDHGALSIAGSNMVRVHSHCMTAQPVKTGWTQYEAADINHVFQIVAKKSDVSIKYGAEADLKNTAATESSAKPGVTVAEGNQFSRFDRDGCPDVVGDSGAQTAANQSIVHTTAFKILAADAAGALIIWLLTHGGGPPVSPTTP